MGYCINWRNVFVFSYYLMGWSAWKRRSKKTKDTRSIIARVACTLFARNLLWYVNTGGRDALMILYRRILSLDRASTLRRAMCGYGKLFGDLRDSEVGRRDIRMFCKSFSRKRTGGRHFVLRVLF